MKVVDATRNPSARHWARYRRCFQGAVRLTLKSKAAAETWNKAQPSLSKLAERGMRAAAEHKFHLRGSTMDAAAYESVREQRAQIVPVVAKSMQDWRVAQLLGYVGVDLERAVLLIEAVGVEAVASAVAFLDIIDVMVLDDGGARGAA